jgi:hypothetical protein
MNANDVMNLLWSFTESELASICNGLGLLSFGQRADLIKTILSEYSVDDISRMGLKNKTKGTQSSITLQNNNIDCLTCGK